MMNTFDCVIVGGGPVGWACALAAISTNAKLRVAVVDRAAQVSAPTGAVEARVYTVSERHLRWLSALGATLNAARTAEVFRIRVFDTTYRDALSIDSRDAGSEKLAAVVEHSALTAALAQQAIARGVNFIQAEVKTTGLIDQKRYVELADGRLLNTALLVVAQGTPATATPVNSSLIEQLFLLGKEQDYDRIGVVANFSVAQSHSNEARQWFIADRSILALLPLPNAGEHAAVSMVWSTTTEHANTLCAHSHEALAEAISHATGGRVTPLSVLSPCQSFPLKLVRIADPVAERALIVGDAAHAIHPLAGQGVNLGLADAQALAEALSQANAVAGDVGHPLLLAKHRRIRYAAIASMQAATDALARIYNGALPETSSPLLPSAPIGDIGMRVLGKLPAFRRMLSSAAR